MSNPNLIDKPSCDLDANQTLTGAFNQVDNSFTINGFLVGKINNKITLTITTTTIANDTQVFSFYCDLTTLIYTFTLVYTDATYGTLISATRTA